MDPATEMVGLREGLGGVTYNHIGGNQINNKTVNYFQGAIGSPSTPILPCSFIEAPLHILSVHFTGRTEELLQIKHFFESPDVDGPIRCVIYASHGVGKSQLSLHFAKSAFDTGKYHYVLWISATTVEKFQRGMAKLLDLIDHKDRYHQEQDVRLMSARRWLDQCGHRWLLVLDNVEHEVLEILREHLPCQNNRGNILFTTRSESLAEELAVSSGRRHHIFELRIPKVQEAVKLLLHHVAGDIDEHRMNKAAEVVECVGCLPLAVAQAGSFMKQSGKSLDDMVGLYQSDSMFEVRSHFTHTSHHNLMVCHQDA
jgi:NB-ARC domain